MPSDILPTDMLLLRLQGDLSTVIDFTHALATAPAYKKLESSIILQAWVKHPSIAYVYLALPFRMALSRRMLEPLAELSVRGSQATVSRLTLLQSLPGASRTHRALFHYVVETTPEVGWEFELQHWYATEHLPGLAAVPGCVQAQRFWNHDNGPRSFASYDLIEEQVLDSPAWLAIRHTPWSDRVRPHFTNTVRTLFTVLQ